MWPGFPVWNHPRPCSIFHRVTARLTVPTILLLLLAACGGSSDEPPSPPVALTGLPVSSLMRIEPDGGRPELFHVPDLAPLDWHAEDRLGKIRQVVGAIADPAQLFVLDRAGVLTAMRLEAGRTRTVVRNAAIATISADGGLFTVDSSGAAWAVGRRTPERYRAAFDQVPDALWAGAGGTLVGYDSSASALAVAGASDTLAVRPIAQGPVAAAPWADLVAVATDSVIWLYQPESARKPRQVAASQAPTALAFSPSGHQLYVADDQRINVIDRFAARVRTRIAVAGPVKALRTDPLGRWLLIRPVTGDSVWVVDLDRNAVAGAVAGGWDQDLPTVASPNTLVVRQGKDVVAHRLTEPGLPESGRLEGAGSALWVAVPWSPLREDLVLTGAIADSAEVVATDSTSAERTYLQVSSSRNPDWATELVKKLAGAGLHATVIPPAADGDPYRVVLGPYSSRDAAEESGKTLGMPYFVVTLPAQPN